MCICLQNNATNILFYEMIHLHKYVTMLHVYNNTVTIKFKIKTLSYVILLKMAQM